MNKRFFASLATGLLAVPLLGLGANALLDDAGTKEAESAANTTTTTGVAAVARDASYLEDLIHACGIEATDLIDLVATGAATTQQQAGLDAVRQICADAGLTVTGPASGEPVVQVTTITSNPPVTSVASTVASVASTVPAATQTTMVDDDDDDEREDDEREDDDREDDDHEVDDHEVDDREDDEREDDEREDDESTRT